MILFIVFNICSFSLESFDLSRFSSKFFISNNPQFDIIKLDSNVFSGFKNLKVMNLQQRVNYIVPENLKDRHVPFGLFNELGNLEELYLGANLITNITKDVYKKLHKLRILNLKENRLKDSLDSDIFNTLRNLESLDLRSNKMQRLPRNIFEGLKKLKILNIGINTLKDSLDSNIFNTLRNLESLNLQSNEIQRLPRNIFKELHNLKTLNLAYNGLENTLDKLKSLNLALNNLGNSLDSHTFNGLSNLIDLSLNSSCIKSLIGSVFIPLTNLRRLSMNGNSSINFKGKHVNQSYNVNVFSGLKKLVELNLSGCTQMELPKQIFDELTGLKRLNLANSCNRSIDHSAFNNLKSLKSLNLESCGGLKNLKVDIFSSLKELEFLNLESS